MALNGKQSNRQSGARAKHKTLWPFISRGRCFTELFDLHLGQYFFQYQRMVKQQFQRDESDH